MKNNLFQQYGIKAIWIFACILGFALITLVYFYPILEGKRIQQNDIEMHKGMSKEIVDYRESTGEQPLWTNSMFGGMPAWNISVENESNLMTPVQRILSVGFPHPIGAVFISMLGFFILLLVLDCKIWVSFIGGLAYGFTSYLFIVIGAGHNSKAMAMAYMAPVIAGILLTYKGKYLWGSVLTSIALALEVRAGHLQITYYLLLIIIILILAELISCIIDKKVPHFFKASGCLIVAALFGIMSNITTLYANYEFGDETTRGKPVLTQQGTDQTQGLDRDYITQWSYGKGETWSLMIPNAKGGASNKIGTKEPALKQVSDPQFREVIAEQNAYWGDQPFTSGPVYVGAIVVFLLVFSIVLLIGEMKSVFEKMPYKKSIPIFFVLFGAIFFILHRYLLQDASVWRQLEISLLLTILPYITYAKPIWTGLLLASILSILLSWGKNFMVFTDFFIDYIPGYNKFRAVSMTLVIAEVCIPLLGFLGLAEIVKHPENRKNHLTKFFIALGITAGCCLLFYFAPEKYFNFLSQNEAQQFAQLTKGKDGALYQSFVTQLENVRVEIFRRDTLRSLLLILFSAIPIYFLITTSSSQKVKEKTKTIVSSLLIGAIGILVLIDLIPIDSRYLNNKDFVSKIKFDRPFTASNVDKYILNDKSLDYRVLNLTTNVFNDASTSYFHKSIGGYHGAKLRRYQDLINGYLSLEIKYLNQSLYDKNDASILPWLQTLNMLDTKYIIYKPRPSELNTDPEPIPIENPYAFGNAWIVNDVLWVDTPNEEYDTIGTIDLRNTAVMHKEFEQKVGNYHGTESVLGTVTLTDYRPNQLTYRFQADEDKLVVFSEIWTEKGWTMLLDGKEHPLMRANYLLRASLIPAGQHEIVMRYEPSIWRTGNTIQLISSLLLILGLLAAITLSVTSIVKKEKESQA